MSLILGMMLAVSACGESMQTASLTKPPPAPPMEPRTWMVFFDTGSVALSEQARATVAAAAASAKEMPSQRVAVTGFTDTEGSAAFNQALSVRRANAVRDALVRAGMPPQSVIVTTGSGESGLLVPTANQVRYPSNRRASIVLVQ
jgi:outer membrane protein OmpA-like peptidoglycan-associated protein